MYIIHWLIDTYCLYALIQLLRRQREFLSFKLKVEQENNFHKHFWEREFLLCSGPRLKYQVKIFSKIGSAIGASLWHHSVHCTLVSCPAIYNATFTIDWIRSKLLRIITMCTYTVFLCTCGAVTNAFLCSELNFAANVVRSNARLIAFQLMVNMVGWWTILDVTNIAVNSLNEHHKLLHCSAW